MKQEEEKSNTIISNLVNKYGLKSVVFENTEKNFRTFKEEMRDLVKAQKENARKGCPDMPFDYRDVGQFQFELLFGSDILVFILHTNVFEFDRSHEVRRTSYIVEENSRSYCGVIKIYNFLSDSFKYDRLNDIGYLVARIFINKENHYYIEGKREISQIYNNFSTAVLDQDSIREIINSAMMYSINFDLLAPPYENIVEVTVEEMQEYMQNTRMRTGKRLGFRFQADSTGGAF